MPKIKSSMYDQKLNEVLDKQFPEKQEEASAADNGFEQTDEEIVKAHFQGLGVDPASIRSSQYADVAARIRTMNADAKLIKRRSEDLGIDPASIRPDQYADVAARIRAQDDESLVKERSQELGIDPASIRPDQYADVAARIRAQDDNKSR